MLAYLIAVSLLIPANLWAAITPHLHSEVSMRILHGLSTLALLPLLWHCLLYTSPSPRDS